MTTRRRAFGRRPWLAALALAAGAVLAPAALSQERSDLPDEFNAAASAAGLSIVSFKRPNPLPVGPGAFATFETPEVFGQLTANRSTARASLLYPGPAIAGMPALMCTAGATPFCGQPPPPMLVEAEHPQRPKEALATDGISLRQPSAPVTAGAGSGQAEAAAEVTTSTVALASYRVDAPDPARAAVLEALAATLDALPGDRRADDTSLLSYAGGAVTQRIAPAGDGAVRAESRSTIDDIRMLAGAVTIESVTVTAWVVADGRGVQASGSTTETKDVLVAGFPATIGPDGVRIDGQGDEGRAREGLTGVAAQVAEAVAMAVDKLDLELRDGAASQTPDGTSAAADGLRLSLAADPLTDTSPPQVPQLCTVTGAVQDPLSSGGLVLPPLCAVPDVTGTTDTYELHLGRASAVLTAQRFIDFGLGTDLDTGLADVASGPVASGAAVGDGALAGGSGGVVAGAPARSTPSLPPAALRPSPDDPGFLAFEMRWLGAAAADRFGDVYLALAAATVALLLLSKVVLRATAVRTGGRRR